MKDKTFSERMGLVPEKAVQIKSMDDGLRNRLWNCFVNVFFGLPDFEKFASFFLSPEEQFQRSFICNLFDKHFKIDVDDIQMNYDNLSFSKWRDTSVIEIRKILDKSEWNEIYDFIEFVINYLPKGDNRDSLIKEINNVLEEEKSGYRFLGSTLVDITDEEEMSVIKEATTLEDKLKVVSNHLEKSLKFYANRENPDYINSIKVKKLRSYLTV
ncbi:MAG: hypothetical protein JW984_07845 [Deltaproteobacteria bacterium]|uniref:HEPN AbiJ-N-terminal domain-containing protein n=1 Tax=Candidatus Zymogenus saltonus TaxID=2844893 RepID=A0A9D8PM62_9DELT|nr:hypothetical protein [Candidatus Zymogenus saltonus]